MKIDDYLKAKESIISQSFERNYRGISKTLSIFSFVGNTASIIFAFTFLYTILNNVYTSTFTGKSIVISIVSTGILIGFESVKRLLFRQTTLNYLKKAKKIELTFTILLSCLIIFTSAFLSISGAKEVADKSKKISVNTDKEIKSVTDSIQKVYAIEINRLNKVKDGYFTFVLTGTKRVALRTQYNQLIASTDKQISDTKKERENALNQAITAINNKTNVQVKESDNNILTFLLISTFIELIILVGVWFTAYYEFQTYVEFDLKINSSNKLKRFLVYLELLHLIYNRGNNKVGTRILTPCKLKSLIKLNDINITDRGVRDFYTLLNHLNITIPETATKLNLNKEYTIGINDLKSYYNLS